MRRRANPGPTRTIALVGLMGVGKSSVGRRLAHRLKLPFADGDVEIEEAAGMTVSEIFAALGEAEFRAGEARVIRRLLEGPPLVLATGGGAMMNPETRANRLAKLGVQQLYQLPFDAAMASFSPEEFVRQVLVEGLGIAHVVVGADFCFGRGRAGKAADRAAAP